MIELTFKDLNKIEELKNQAKRIKSEDKTLLENYCREDLNIYELINLDNLMENINIAGKINKVQYSKAVKNLIAYAVKINLKNEKFQHYISSKKYRSIFEDNYKYKQGLIIVIESAIAKLPEFYSYAEKISIGGVEFKYKATLDLEYKHAKNYFKNLCDYYDKRSKSLLRSLYDNYKQKSYYQFSNAISENQTLKSAALKMIDAKEKRNADIIKQLDNFSSITLYWKERGRDFQNLSVKQLLKFLGLIKHYVNEFHKWELKEEEKKGSRKSSMKHYKKENPGYTSRKEKKRKVFELHEIYKKPKEIAEKLANTPYETTRQTISKWIKMKEEIC